MKPKILNRRRLFRIIGVLLILLIVVLYIGFPLAMALTAIAPQPMADREPPEGFNNITVTTADGLALGAWYSEPTNNVAIILIHGAGSGRESTRAYAQMLHEQGFGVLALSMSGYGDSEGRINRLGWNGTRDVGAAIAYLQGRDNVRAIGALGLSMGGEILLGAASSYPMLQAIAVEGATYRTVNEYVALPMNQALHRNFTHRVFSFMVGLLTGDSQPHPPLFESIQSADTTAFLFMAAGENDEEITFNTFYHDSIPNRSTLWIIPNVAHTGGFSRYPAEYAQRITDFFTAQLIDSPVTSTE